MRVPSLPCLTPTHVFLDEGEIRHEACRGNGLSPGFACGISGLGKLVGF